MSSLPRVMGEVGEARGVIHEQKEPSMHTANRLLGLQQSVIREMMRLAIQHDALNLAQGSPGFDPPPEVLEAAADALRGGANQYSITWGITPLREALAQKYADWYTLTYDPTTEITVTCGVTEAIIAAVLGIVNPGEKVIVIEPAHENYHAAIRFAGGETLSVAMHAPNFTLDVDMLRDAFRQNPKAIIFNSPQNPSGRVFDRPTLQLIADLCIEHDVIAITDEIYEHIIYDDREHIPLALLPGMQERTIITSGLSKTYAATGWRIAWVLAPHHLSDAARTIHDYTTICAPVPLQTAAVTALSLPRSFYADLIDGYTRRRNTIIPVLREAGFQLQQPEGAYYVLADFSAIRPDLGDFEFARWLTIEKKIAVVPGSSFYNGDKSAGRKLVRFAFPKSIDTLQQVAERLMK